MFVHGNVGDEFVICMLTVEYSGTGSLLQVFLRDNVGEEFTNCMSHVDCGELKHWNSVNGWDATFRH